MLKFKEINFKAIYPGFGKGSRPGYSCSVELQHGERSFESVTLTLDPDATREVIAFAVGKAIEKLSFDHDSIDVAGNPGVPREEEPTPQPDMAAEPMVIEAPAEEVL